MSATPGTHRHVSSVRRRLAAIAILLIVVTAGSAVAMYRMSSSRDPKVESDDMTTQTVQTTPSPTLEGIAAESRRLLAASLESTSPQEPAATDTQAPELAAQPQPTSPGFTVCIDPGHQQRADLRLEPIGPGSSTMKERCRGGTTGNETSIAEYRLTLIIAKALASELAARGIGVVLTRDTHDANISNKERAEFAAAHGADLFLRLHLDGATDRHVRGALTLYPAVNEWTGPIADRSLAAAKIIHHQYIAGTGLADRGLVARTDISGFNWSTVPAVLVELAMLTNHEDEALAVDPAFQARMARALADGVIAFRDANQ